MKKTEKGIMIFSIVFGILLLSMSFVYAEDVEDISNNQIIEKENSTVDNSNISIKTSAEPTNVSQNSVINTAEKVKKYTEKNKKLPNSVIIGKYKYSMPEFYYMMSKTISYKNKNIKSAVNIKYNIKNPSKPAGSWIEGRIYSYYYSIYANKIVKYMDKYNKTPDTVITAGKNKMQYQTNVYLFAKILSSTKNKLPYYVTVNIKSGDSINKYLPNYDRDKTTTKLLGSDSFGYVHLLGPFGNPDSKIKIAYIIGMHPLESRVHNALYETLKVTKNLNYAYYIYKINVTKNARDYSQGRMGGQLIAQKYVLLNIKLNKYNLVIDVHSNLGTVGGNYEKTNFIFAPLNSASSKTIAKKIINNVPGLSYYYPVSQTSPLYCTEPLVRSGMKAIIYETYFHESVSTTLKYIKQLIAEVDKLEI